MSKQKIGNYTVLQTLGVGSFGKVKLAVHSQTGHKVALKIIGRSKLAHSDMIGRVNREIQYLKMLRHPHIIKLYEVITTPTDIIMVIEYAGGELFNYIVERGRMNERDGRRFFQQIVSAVEYCHRRNIVHRDLKPENVLLDPYDNVKVADFGLSNIMKDGEFLQTSCGSPNYAAPEVINGKLYAGPEVDAWSCGVILYVMLCGRLPFDDDHIPALFKKITSGIFTMPGYLSQGARAILSGLLQVDPLKRMTLAQVRQHPWFTTDLPEYLKPLPESTDIECLASLDESIIRELERQLEMDRAVLITQLRQRGTNPAKVAYQLTLDNRHMLEQSRNSNKQGIRNFALASSPPAAFQLSSSMASSSPMVVDDKDSAKESEDDDDLHTPSSIAILGSSLPRSPGHTLESQMYKMRLRGPNANAAAGGSAQQAAPRVSSPLASASQQPSKPPPGPSTLAQHALGATSGSPSGSQTSPSRTPSNYFRASLPPLAGTPSSPNQSNSSSIASLAHASLKAQPTSINPYSHRSESASGSPIPPNAIANNIAASGIASSPLARTKDIEMADALSDTNSDGTQRRPTVMRKRAKLTRTRWHFGIRSRSPPADVMAEVYRALQQLDMKWKHFNPYHLRARYIPPGATVEEAVKIDLQLYKLDSRDNYLVDFKAVIPQPRALEDGVDSGTTTYRAGENTLISPLPPFIQAARRRMSAAVSPSQAQPGSVCADNAMLVDSEPPMSSEPRSLDDQFLDSSYPIQLPAELPASQNSAFAVAAATNDRSDMLPAPDSLPAKTIQRRLGGTSPPIMPLSANGMLQGFDSDDSGNLMGIPIPGSVSSKPMAMDIPRSKLSAPTPNTSQNTGVVQAAAAAAAVAIANAGHVVGSASSPSANMQFIGGTPRSQGRAPGSYMPGSVIGRVSLARADVSLTADGVGAGSGSNRQSQERVVNIFPFFDVCCKLITELAVPSANAATAPAGAPAS
ncbi:Protein kinase [Coemansia sp. RSA 485]|nr:Protein kinase [Coemansia sp. RSA 485]